MGSATPTPRDGQCVPANTNNLLLWTCNVCKIEVNIFERSDHLHSFSHRSRLLSIAKENGVNYPQPAPETWHCEICDLDLPATDKNAHLAGWWHAVGLHVAGAVKEKEVPQIDDVSKWPNRNTFYCLTCQAEFPLQEQDEHIIGGVCRDTVPESWTDSDSSPSPSIEETFICATCSNRSFPVSEKHLHDREWRCSLCPAFVTHKSAKRLHMKTFNHNWHCELCDKTVKLIGRESHEAGPKHRGKLAEKQKEMLTAPAAMGMEIKPVVLGSDQAVVANQDQFHCDLCQLSMDAVNRDSHLAGRRHQTALGGGEHENTIRTTFPKFYCEICHLSMNIIDKDTHLAGQRHQRKIRPAEGQITFEQHQKATGKVTSQNQLFCPDLSQPDSTFAAKHHDASHSQLLESLASATSQHIHSRQTGGVLVPPAPPAPISKTEIESSSPPIQKPLNLGSSNVILPLETEQTFFCQVCKRSMGISSRESHLEGKRHQQAVETMEYPVQQSVFCGFCKTSITGRVESHMASEVHRRAMESAMPGLRSAMLVKTVGANPAAKDAQIVGGKNYSHLKPILFTASGRGYCSICSIEVAEGIEEHVASMQHQNAVRSREKTTATNDTPQTDSRSTYHCDICSKNFFAAHREIHLKGRIHAQALEASKRPSQLKKQEASLGKMPSLANQRGAPPSITPKIIQSSAALNPKVFYCQVCSEWKSEDGRAGHEAGLKHKKKLKEKVGVVVQTRKEEISETDSIHSSGSNSEEEAGGVKLGIEGPASLGLAHVNNASVNTMNQKDSESNRSLPYSAFILQSASSTGRLYCDACERQLQKPTGFIAHMKGKTHRRIMEAKVEASRKETNVQTMSVSSWPETSSHSVNEAVQRTRPRPSVRHNSPNGGRLEQYLQQPSMQLHLYPERAQDSSKTLVSVAAGHTRHVGSQLELGQRIPGRNLSNSDTKPVATLKQPAIRDNSTDNAAHLMASTSRQAAFGKLNESSRHWEVEKVEAKVKGEAEVRNCELCEMEIHPKIREEHESDEFHIHRLAVKRLEEGQEKNTPTAEPPLIDSREQLIWCFTCTKTYSSRDNNLHSSLPWHCEVCDMILHTDAKSHHVSSLIHRLNAPVAEITNIEPVLTPAGDETFFCLPCRCNIPKTDRKLHLSPAYYCALCARVMHADTRDIHEWSLSHTRAANAATNRPVRKSEHFSCQTCQKRLPVSVQPFHRSRPWTCESCNVTVHMDWIGAHLMSNEHRGAEAEAAECLESTV